MRFVANIVFANFSKSFERVDNAKGRVLHLAAQSYATQNQFPAPNR